jgi:signal transduction histidine kinase
MVLVDSGVFGFPASVQLGFPGEVALSTLTLIGLLLGWGALSFLTLYFLGQDYRSSKTILRKNRVRYWMGAFVLYFLGSLGVILRFPLAGSVLYFLLSLVITYIVRTYRLPDLQNVAVKLISNSLAGTLALLVYTLTFILSERLLTPYPWYHPLLSGVVLGTALILFYQTLLENVIEVVENVLGAKGDQNRALREYSTSISNILDVEVLATVAVGLISEILEARGGTLYLVDELDPENGVNCWRLRGAKGMGDPFPGLDCLPETNVLAQVLAGERRPLTQSEMDISLEFKTLPRDLYQWLLELDVEVFVPVHTTDEWVGLFALRPKRSGASYTSQDLDVLSTFADQTAVALQNARLVDSLLRLNEEYQKAYQAMESALKKLERIERTKSDFINITSHELRTPLSMLHGYVEMLTEETDLANQPEYRQITESILENINRMHKILESMLDIAKMDSHVLELTPRSIIITEVVEDVCEGMDDRFQKHNISLKMELPDDLPYIRGDTRSLEKVFSQLLLNALIYTPEGGNVHIRGRYHSKGVKDFPEECVEIVVQDTGVGIDPSLHEFVFTPFFQTGEEDLHPRESGEGERLGLGLAVVRGIVEAHGGRVWVESSGQDPDTFPGSAFHVVFPLHHSLTAHGKRS